MSEDPLSKEWTLRNERALLSITRHPERSLFACAAIWKVPKDELQAWLDHYNGGSTKLSEARIRQVKEQLGSVSVGRADPRPVPPAAIDPSPAQAGSSAMTPPAEAIPLTPATSTRVPRAARISVQSTQPIPKMKTEPWLKAARGPQQRSVDKHRKFLEKIAAGEAIGGDPALAQFLKKWTGTPVPDASTVKAFLDWLPAIAQGEQGESTDSAPNMPQRAKRAGKRRAVKASPKSQPPPQKGWEELELVNGRYSGAGDNPAITLGAQFCRQHAAHVAGMRARIFWNAKDRQLRFLINGAGLPLTKDAGAIVCASRSLPSLLGAEPIEFSLLSSGSGKAGAELLLEEVASE